jgi:hypothetical protein
LCKPILPLVQMPVHEPELAQRSSQPQAYFRFFTLPRPMQRGPQIVVLRLQPIQPGRLFRPG